MDIKKTIIAILIISSKAEAISSRSYSLSESNISTSAISSAVFINPSLISKNYQNKSIELTIINAYVEDNRLYTISEKTKEINSVINSIVNIKNVDAEIEKIAALSSEIDEINTAKLKIAWHSSLAIQFKLISIGVAINNFDENLSLPLISEEDKDAGKLKSNISNVKKSESKLLNIYKTGTKYSITAGRRIFSKNIHGGINFHVVSKGYKGEAINIAEKSSNYNNIYSKNDLINLYKTARNSADRELSYNFDAGITYYRTSNSSVSLVIKNILHKNKVITLSDEIEAQDSTNLQITAGSSIFYSNYSINFAIDLNKTLNYQKFKENDQSMDIDKKDDEQYFRLGFEGTIGSSVRYMAGTSYNMRETWDQAIKFSLGLNAAIIDGQFDMAVSGQNIKGRLCLGVNIGIKLNI